jgi:gamma-glutamylcyclotransferase (GGCT)/AIG2-like uncharacterized protein YtfP
MKGYEEMQYTIVNGYKMFSNGHFPCALKGDKKDRIFGEVYFFKKNSKNILKNLDMLEGFQDKESDLYKRIKIRISFKGKIVTCFMYLYNKINKYPVRNVEYIEIF